MTLKVKDLRVRVADQLVVKGVSLSIERGRIAYLMGPNGAGKSTLLHAIMGFSGYRVEHGVIMLNGVDVTSKPLEERARLGIAIALQNPPSLEGVTVGKLLTTLVERYWRVTRLQAMRIVQDILRKVGLSPRLLEREFHVGLSGGERKKLELAKVLAMRPRVALLDEPDSGVDVDSLAQIGEAIKTLVREYSASVLVVTHTARLCKFVKPDESYVMIDGRIVARGSHELVRIVEEKGYTAFTG